MTSTIIAPKPSRNPNAWEISSISCSERSRMRTPSQPQRVAPSAPAASSSTMPNAAKARFIGRP